MAPASKPIIKSILLVESEPLLLKFVRTVLEIAGFEVLSARTAEGALRIAQESGKTIDLLLTGLSMPGMSVPELAEQLKDRRGLPVMLMSSEPAARTIAIDHGWYFTEKPFSASVLLQGVRSVSV